MFKVYVHQRNDVWAHKSDPCSALAFHFLSEQSEEEARNLVRILYTLQRFQAVAALDRTALQVLSRPWGRRVGNMNDWIAGEFSIGTAARYAGPVWAANKCGPSTCVVAAEPSARTLVEHCLSIHICATTRLGEIARTEVFDSPVGGWRVHG